MTSRVSLTELAAAGIRLRPAEAATLVAEICRQQRAGKLRGIPSAGVIRITRDGDVVAEGPVTTNQDVVRCAAHLLNALVGGFEAPPEYRASGALQLVIARALRTLDLPSYETFDEFCAALDRFATLDVHAAARDLFKDWIRTRMPREAIAAPLTISDVRRARRATGLTLQDIAAVAGMPAARLRDLEWGDVRQWRADAEGREQVTRYARAAGLDEQLVLSIAWPMIEDAFARADAAGAPVTALVPSGPQQLAPVAFPAPRATAWASRPGWVTAAAALVLALIAMFVLTWQKVTDAPAARREPVTALVPSGPQQLAPVAFPAPRATTWASRPGWVTAAAALVLALIAMFVLTWQKVTDAPAARREPVPVLNSAPVSVAVPRLVAASEPARPTRAARTALPRKTAAKRAAPRRTSIFQKELFRIDIR